MSLAENQEFEVLIVGGGVIGLTIARELKKRGAERVCIVEKRAGCGLESSSAAAGMLAPQAEANADGVFFRFCYESRNLYPQFAAELSDETSVDIEFDQTGTIYLAFSEEDSEEIEKRFEWQSNADLPVEKLNEWEIAELEPNLSKFVVGGLRFPLDWQVKNTMLVAALAKFLPPIEVANLSAKNSSGWVSATVESLIFENGKIAGVQTEQGALRAPVVILASGAWTSLLNLPSNFADFIKIAPVRGQMMSFRDNDKPIGHNVYTPRGYIVPRRGRQIMVGATVEHAGFDARTTGAGVSYLLETAFEIAPHLQNLSVNKFWAGLRPKSPDGLPLIGEFPADSNLYFATGHFRNGILLAPLTARIIADKIAKNIDSPFLKTFNPSRFVNSF